MKFYRYMSIAEFAKVTAGVPLVYCNGAHKARTSSEGFCFLPEVIRFTSEDGTENEMTPEQAIRFLSGIVTDDVLVEFEADSATLHEGFGIYADPYCCYWDAVIAVTEYSCDAYSRETMEPLRYNVGGVWYAVN